MSDNTFAAAFGAYSLAGIEAGGFDDPAKAAARREQDALEALIAIRSPHVAGILGKVEIVADHVRDYPETYGRLVGELAACDRELSGPAADLAQVGEALAVVARRFEREGLFNGFVRLLGSAAEDARALAA
ncbi:MAG: hypothetical protein KXJ53_13885 [Phenylobacterium sp.]|jgi:hypothetical protein|nr:hypothetical protein [Phenylobacterium sp.]